MGVNLADPATLLGILLLVAVAVFIFYFNALSMRRTQLDRSIHHVREILRRRSAMVGIPFDNAVPIAELLAKDEAAAFDGGEETQKEFADLSELLEETLETARNQLGDYNRLVDNKLAKLLHYTARAPF